MTPIPKSHYQVLSLPAEDLIGKKLDRDVLKKAYHRALLLSHPDKEHQKQESTSTSQTSEYTLDQIRIAYATLADDETKARYDRRLRDAPNKPEAVETVDLDDMNYSLSTGQFTRSCRCGAKEGFVLDERQLESHGEKEEVRSLIIGCGYCSLFIEVEWEVVGDDDP